MTSILEGRAPAPINVERLARHDSLPEHVTYRDEGCDLSVSCLACPLPRCRYDEPGGARSMLNRVRDDEIRRLYEMRLMAVDEIAVQYRISRRTVFRVLEAPRHREAAARLACSDPAASPSKVEGNSRSAAPLGV